MSTYPDRGVPRRRTRGRPPKISQQAIVDAAVSVGLDQLTMARLARELDVSTQALYGHVGGRAEVEALVRGALRAEVAATPIEADGWRPWLEEFAHVVRRSLVGSARTQGLAPALDLGFGERGLALLMAEGLDAEEAGRAVWLVFRTALGAGPGTGDDVALARFVARTEAVTGSAGRRGKRLPATEAVRAALAGRSGALAATDTFSFDLATVLDGIEARIARRPTRSQEAP